MPTPTKEFTEASLHEASLLLKESTRRNILEESSSIIVPPTSPTPTTSLASVRGEAGPNKCRPWSEADYFARLRTFTPPNWFGKPLIASAPRCAAAGWINSAMDTLECLTCPATMKVESHLDSAVVPDVSRGHEASCPWNGLCCTPETTQFPLTTPESLLESLGRRYQGCKAMMEHYHGRLGVDIPTELSQLVESSGLSIEALARRLHKEVHPEVDLQEGLRVKAVTQLETWAAILALYGWQASRQPEEGRRGEIATMGWVLVCGLCGRRCQAWRVVSSSSPSSKRVMEGEDRSKARRVEDGIEGGGSGSGGGGAAEPVGLIDTVRQHRWYCPWIHSGLEGVGGPGYARGTETVMSRCPRSWFATNEEEQTENGGGGGCEGGGAEKAISTHRKPRRSEEEIRWVAARPGDHSSTPPQKPEEIYERGKKSLAIF